MVGPVHDLLVDRLDGPRWELALDLLRSGSGAVNLNGLVLSTDPATAAISRRLHVEFECPFDPSLVNQAPHERLRVVAENDLGRRGRRRNDQIQGRSRQTTLSWTITSPEWSATTSTRPGWSMLITNEDVPPS